MFSVSQPGSWRCELPGAIAVVKRWRSGEVSADAAMVAILEIVDRQVQWPAPEGDLADLGLAVGAAVDMRFQHLGSAFTDFFQQPPRLLFSAAQVSATTFAELLVHIAKSLRHARSRVLDDKYLCAVLEGALLVQECGAEEVPQREPEDAWLSAVLRGGSSGLSAAEELAMLDRYLLRLVRMKRRLAAALARWGESSYYRLLGVTPDCSDDELKKAYRAACRRLHPDKGGDKDKFQALQRAYAAILEQRTKGAPTSDAAEPGDADAAPRTSAAGAPPPEAGGRAPGSGEPASSAAPFALEGLDASANPEVRGHQSFVAFNGLTTAMTAKGHAVRASLTRAHDLLSNVGIFVANPSSASVAPATQALEDALRALEACPLEDLSDAVQELAHHATEVSARWNWVPAASLLRERALACAVQAASLARAREELARVAAEMRDTLAGLLQTLGVLQTVDARTTEMAAALLAKGTARCERALQLVDPWVAKAEAAAADVETPLADVLAMRHFAPPEAPEEPPADSESPEEEASDPPPGAAAQETTAGAAQPEEDDAATAAALAKSRQFFAALNRDVRELQKEGAAWFARHAPDVPELVHRRLFALAAEYFHEAIAEHRRAGAAGTKAAFAWLESPLALPTDPRTQVLRLARVVDEAALEKLLSAARAQAGVDF